MRHLAIILHNLEAGGMQRVILNLLQEFGQQKPDLKIDLVVAIATGEMAKSVPPGINLIDLNSPFSFRTKSLIQLIPKIRSYLQAQHPEIVLSCLPSFNVLTLIAGWGIRPAPRLMLAEHTLPFNQLFRKEVSQGPLPGLLPKVSMPLMRFTYPQADCTIAVSEGIAQELRQTLRLPPKSVQVIYNPVVDSTLLQQSQMAVEHPWLVTGEPVFITVGRLAKQKDHATLIRAFAQLRQGQAAKLLIIGEGELRSQLTTLIRQLGMASDIELLGFVDNPYTYIRQATAFVLSSVWETFGVVLVEALACGCPVISTDCDYGPREILAGGKYGQLVPVGDVDALAIAMTEVLSSPPPNPDILKTRAQDFTLEKAASHYLQLMASYQYM